MKRLLQRTVSLLMALVGVFGVAFSGYAVRQIWSTADRMGREIPAAIGQLESVGRSVHRQGEKAVDVLQTTRGRLSTIQDTVEGLPRSREDRQVTTVLNRLDAEVVEHIERAEEFVRSMRSSLEGASRAVLLLESIPFLGPRVSSPSAASEENLTSLAGSLSEVSGGLGQLTRILAEIRTSRRVDPSNLAQLTSILEEVDEQLGRIQADIEVLSTETNAVVLSLAGARRRSERWIQRTAALCTLFFVCFGCSQLHLLVLLRRPPP